MCFSNPKVQRQGLSSHMKLRAVYLEEGKPDRRTVKVSIMNAGFLYGLKQTEDLQAFLHEHTNTYSIAKAFNSYALGIRTKV